MADEAPTQRGSWKDFALFLLKLTGYLAALALFGLATYWLRRSLH